MLEKIYHFCNYDCILLILTLILWVGLMWATVKSMKKEPEHKPIKEKKDKL